MDGGDMRIDCDDCAMQGTDQCGDCVVSFILERDDGAVVVDGEEARALRDLGEAGLVPLLRLVPKPSEEGGGRDDRRAG
jgi:hypothetical protein